MKHQFTKEQILAITMAVVEGIAEHVDLTPGELERYGLAVHKGVMQGLSAVGAAPPWHQSNLRKIN